MAERWGPLRRLISRVATLLARPFAGDTRDPMSGFFALRRETWERARRLTPLGYKVGLELMCKCRVASVREVPIHFDSRAPRPLEADARLSSSATSSTSAACTTSPSRGRRRS